MPIDFDKVSRHHERLVAAKARSPGAPQTKAHLHGSGTSTTIDQDLPIDAIRQLHLGNLAPTQHKCTREETLSKSATRELCAAVYERLPRELRDMINEALCANQTVAVQASSLRSKGYFENTRDFHWCNPQYSGHSFAREAVETYYEMVEFSFFVWDFDLQERFMSHDKFGFRDLRPAERVRSIEIQSQWRFSISSLRPELLGFYSTTLAYIRRTMDKSCRICLLYEYPSNTPDYSDLRIRCFEFVAPELYVMQSLGFTMGIRWEDGVELWPEYVQGQDMGYFAYVKRGRLNEVLRGEKFG